MATHNSVGAGYQIIEADEVETGADNPAAGTITPDVGEDLRADFHEDAIPDDPRPAPEDQTGDRYRDCDKPADAASEDDGYNPQQDTSDCYIGFIDGQLEYYFLYFWSAKFTGSDRYSVNPAEDDGYCRGSEDTGDRGAGGAGVPIVVGEDSTVDETVTRVTRVDDDECSGSDHVAYDPPQDFVGIDTDLLEGPSEAAGEAIGTNTGSGTLTFPVLKEAYVFLFGEPFSDDTASGFTAGEGVFGPNPAELGNPLHDLTGACGTGDDKRTQDCQLLSNEDVKAYDTRRPAGTEGEGARVCWMMPQYFTLNPGALSAGACGPFGNIMEDYYEDTQLGGFGTDQPTWINNLPGWHTAANVLNDQSTTEVADVNCDGGSMCHDYLEDGNVMEPGNLFYWVVNPKVPTPDHPLWCVLPNFIGEAGNIDAEGGAITDNGFYNYTADAIDSDVYTHFSHQAVLDAREVAHDPVRDVVRPIQEASPIHRSDVTSPQALAAADELSSGEDAERQIEDEFPDLDDPIDRADPTEAGSTEDHSKYHATDYDGTTEINHRPFTKVQKKGLACKAEGVPEKRTQESTLEGGTLFDVGLSHQTLNLVGTPVLKDFTHLDEDGMVPNEDDTEHGAWEAKSYSFGGPFRGVFDSNGDKEFDACTQALGQAQPSRDFCPWQPLWDAYNPDCTGGPAGETPCETIVNSSGYDNETGVGLFGVLHVSGPTVVYGEDQDTDRLENRLAVLGDQSATTATHCVVMTTRGFAPKLADHFGVTGSLADEPLAETPEPAPDAPAVTGPNALTDRLCRDDLSGEAVLIADAFEDQGGTGSNGFGGQIEFLKLLPTPDAVRNDMGTGFGDGDELCMNAVLSTQSNLDPQNFTSSDDDSLLETDDTVNNTRLEEGHNQPDPTLANPYDAPDAPYHFKDCDALESSNEAA